jgi:ribokinase
MGPGPELNPELNFTRELNAMASARILVVGSLNMDLVVSVKSLPLKGETVTGSRFDMYPGGKGANQAVASARMGARVEMIGAVGRDSYGETLLEGLKRDGIETSRILARSSKSGTGTGIALITVDAQGHNSIVVVAGANATLRPQDLDLAAEAFDACDGVLLQFEVPMETVLHAAELSHRRGKRVILNPAPFQPIPDRLRSLTDLLVVNEIEGGQLTGLVGQSPEKTLQQLRDAGFKQVLLTHGDQGVYFADGLTSGHLPALKVEAVDTTGAGDTFTGAFAAFYPEFGFHRALELAIKAASIAVTRPGAQSSIPVRAELGI